ncbi:hypothetical protein DRE_04512 [Drechslerella stenobrocha 248]|uniref:Uncharacterized protein n=1 Tax=Drechslerella stenobrocha 248 TaxID=1043628 RepID=W7HQA2_9PEZI|nr:hypothetical protein DRE_04512 [Drechslerella stenobrocha 248]
MTIETSNPGCWSFPIAIRGRVDAIRTIGVFNNFEDDPMLGVALFSTPNCQGDPTIFTRRIDALPDSLVAQYLFWRVTTAADLGGDYADFAHPTDLATGGYVVLDGDAANPQRSAPFCDEDLEAIRRTTAIPGYSASKLQSTIAMHPPADRCTRAE